MFHISQHAGTERTYVRAHACVRVHCTRYTYVSESHCTYDASSVCLLTKQKMPPSFPYIHRCVAIHACRVCDLSQPSLACEPCEPHVCVRTHRRVCVWEKERAEIYPRRTTIVIIFVEIHIRKLFTRTWNFGFFSYSLPSIIVIRVCLASSRLVTTMWERRMRCTRLAIWPHSKWFFSWNACVRWRGHV